MLYFRRYDDRAIVHPGPEHGADGAEQLIPGRLGELLADALLDQRLEADDQFLQVVDGQLGVFDVLMMAVVLQAVNHRLERVVVLVGTLLHAEHDVAVHLDEAAVAVPRKARVAGLGRERLDGLVVQPEVEDRVHHAGHRVARAGADRDQQRVLQITERLARLLLERRNALFHLAAERRRVRALVGVVVGADFGRDREAWGHRQPDAAHLGEVRALAAEQRLHRSVAIRLAAEEVDVLPRLRSRFLRRLLLRGRLLRRGLRARLAGCLCLEGGWLRGGLRACELLCHR